MIPPECPSFWQEAIGTAEARALAASLEKNPPVSIRLHPQKGLFLDHVCDLSSFSAAVPWCSTGRYLGQRPVFTLDPHFHAGAYYVQEASSMFLAQLSSLFETEGVKKVLDLCASPGGKSTLLAEMLPSDGLLVSNEVIRTRVGALAENIAKWGFPNVLVSNNDAKDFAALPHYFDMILVDAPCSGEGMFRKDPKALEEWSLINVQLCAQRQRRILSDVWSALRPGGWLIYSTCTFNRMENEDNVHWLCSEFGATKCAVNIDPAWGIWEQEACYRFLPHRIQGEGLFFALLQKPENMGIVPARASKAVKTLAKPEKKPQNMGAVAAWLREAYVLQAKGDLVKAYPQELYREMLHLERLLKVQHSGVAVAQSRGKDWIPEADLALSGLLRTTAFPAVEVDLSTAQRYLAKETFSLSDAPFGYILLQYQDSHLGFAKNLGNRINNLYPPARRIRMDLK